MVCATCFTVCYTVTAEGLLAPACTCTVAKLVAACCSLRSPCMREVCMHGPVRVHAACTPGAGGCATMHARMLPSCIVSDAYCGSGFHLRALMGAGVEEDRNSSMWSSQCIACSGASSWQRAEVHGSTQHTGGRKGLVGHAQQARQGVLGAGSVEWAAGRPQLGR